MVAGRTDREELARVESRACCAACSACACRRICGCACAVRYEMICSAVMPALTARCTELLLILPVTRFGCRDRRFTNSDSNAICSDDDVYAYTR